MDLALSRQPVNQKSVFFVTLRIIQVLRDLYGTEEIRGNFSYKLYGSSTTQATIGQPDGSSILCLSCHDGTISLGNVMSRLMDIA